ncbi:MAG: DUF362 domain-containing protein [Corallococcus sp.]|nr:DUF362 domain-containing protein [Corallococcus sp.]
MSDKIKVAMADAASYEQAEIDNAVGSMLAELGGIEHIVPYGAKVLIKANLVRDMPPEQAGTTHPTVLIALIKQLTEKCNAKVVVGDSSGGAYTKGYMSAVYNKCKMTEIPRLTNALLNYDFGYTRTEIDGVRLKAIDICDSFLNADAVINVGKLKTHSFAGYSGAVKNNYGLLPGLVKVEVHSRYPDLGEFCDVLIDIERFSSQKTVLNVLDGVIGMEGAGPTNGKPKFIGKIIASQNAYLCDVVAVSLFDDPFKQPLIQKAIERGLVKEDLSNLDCDMQAVKACYIQDYDRVEVVSANTFLHMPRWMKKLAKKQLTPKVTFKKKVCKGCGKCAAHCPAKAIAIDKTAKVDQSKCIRCFCCQELCPFDAVKLKRPLLYRVARGLTHGRRKKQ